jgi:hypothetical protein
LAQHGRAVDVAEWTHPLAFDMILEIVYRQMNGPLGVGERWFRSQDGSLDSVGTGSSIRGLSDSDLIHETACPSWGSKAQRATFLVSWRTRSRIARMAKLERNARIY